MRSPFTPPPMQGNRERLGVLRRDLPDVSALLLQSIADTHADVLQLDDCDESYQIGIRAVSGTFTHRPTGRRYIVAVCLVPAESGSERGPEKET